MDDVTRGSAAKAAWDTSSDQARRGTQHGFFRRAFRWVVHFLSYNFILSRPTIRTSYAAGFRLSVRPTVFHPKFFISSEKFASFLDTLDLTGKRVCEIGTGTGILALAAARAGAANVVATDINPNASLSANENAHANGLGDRVTGVCTNLMAALAPRPLFDVILSSPPKHAGEPKDLTDRGWHAGPEYRDIKEMFDQARDRLKPDGRIYLMLSSDTDLDLFASLIQKAGFTQRKLKEYSLVVESLIIYELQVR
jgi:methylase of polypeptide subunit release factors